MVLDFLVNILPALKPTFSNLMSTQSSRHLHGLLSVLIKSLSNCPPKKKNCIQVLVTRTLLGVGSDWRMQPLGDAL